jgi:gas vesicle protein
MSDRNDFGSFLAGFIVGGLTGAVVALVLAPQSGEETRTIIKEKAIELKDKAADTYDEVYTDAKSKADELTSIAKKRAAELQVKGKAFVDGQKSKLAATLEPAPKIKKTPKPA